MAGIEIISRRANRRDNDIADISMMLMSMEGIAMAHSSLSIFIASAGD